MKVEKVFTEDEWNNLVIELWEKENGIAGKIVKPTFMYFDSDTNSIKESNVPASCILKINNDCFK